MDSLREDIQEIKQQHKEDDKDLWEEVNKLRERVNALERWQSLCYGIAAVGGVLIGIILKSLNLQ